MIPDPLHTPNPLFLSGEKQDTGLSRLQPCSISTPQPHSGAGARECISLPNISAATQHHGYFWPFLALSLGVLFQQEPSVPGWHSRGWLQLEDPQSCPNPPSAPSGLRRTPSCPSALR